MSPNVSHLLTAVMDDDILLDELETLIEQYPNIAARLIALANSVWSAPVSEIAAIRPACSRLGMKVVRTVAIALTISSPFDASRCPGFDTRRFWCTSLILADAAEKLVEYFDVDPGLARTAGLFRHLGLLWLASEIPDYVSLSLEITNADATVSLDQMLVEQCDVGYLEATGALLRAWQLPAVLTDSLQAGPAGERSMGSLLQLASDIAAVLYAGLHGEAPNELRSEVVQADDLADICDDLSRQTQQTWELAKSLFA